MYCIDFFFYKPMFNLRTSALKINKDDINYLRPLIQKLQISIMKCVESLIAAHTTNGTKILSLSLLNKGSKKDEKKCFKFLEFFCIKLKRDFSYCISSL